jgi:hypothetical protein
MALQHIAAKFKKRAENLRETTALSLLYFTP